MQWLSDLVTLLVRDSFGMDSAGLMRAGRNIQTDIAEWDDCIACPEFEHCYELCMAKLALENAISRS